MKKILVIDDNTEILDTIKDIFSEHFKVLLAKNGKSGIKLAKRSHPDIILCDLMMPEMDGMEVKRRLSGDNETSLIPFIFLTAKTDIQSMRQGMELGADDYIIKPVRVKDLFNLVNKRLERIYEFSQMDKSISDEETDKKLALTEDGKLMIKSNNEYTILSINKIVMIGANDDYSFVYSEDKHKVLVKKSLKSWENSLPDNVFIRAHRNTIININFIEKIEPYFNGTFVAQLKHYPEKIHFSQRYSQRIRKLLSLK